jgi:hypothetical protein
VRHPDRLTTHSEADLRNGRGGHRRKQARDPYQEDRLLPEPPWGSGATATVAGMPISRHCVLRCVTKPANILGTGLGDRWREPQGHSGNLKATQRKGRQAA